MRKNSRPPTPPVCPVCGEEVPLRAPSCPECGADHESGWREGAEVHNGLDLRDDDFDYDAFVADEFGGASPQPLGIRWIWWVTALVLLVLAVWGYLRVLH